MPPEAEKDDLLGLEPDAPLESKTDADLGELFRQAGEGAGDGLEPAKEEAKEEAKPAATTDDLAAMRAENQKTREELIELKTQNEIYRSGLLRTQQAQVPVQVVETKPKGLMERLGLTPEKLNEGLRTNAAGTIADLVERASEEAYQRAKAEATTDATRAATGANAQNQAFLQDQSSTTAEYGELLGSNTEFSALANKIYSELTANGPVISNDGTRWVPRAMYLATSTAYAQMAKAGKFTPAVTEKPGLKLVEKPKQPLSPVTGTATDTTAGGNPLTAGLSAEDLSHIRTRASKLGIPPERFLKTLQAMRKRDPGFGGLG